MAAHRALPRTRMPGFEGFWVFIAGDLGLFTLLFVSFMTARADTPASFAGAQTALSPNHGGVNTLLLLTSSWAVARALMAARECDQPKATRWLAWGIAGGLGFAVSKVLEYADKAAQGYTPVSNEFFMYYYMLTGIHLAHVLVGCVLLLLLWRSWRGQLPGRLVGAESLFCYWHMVDLLWIVLFPLLYLTR